MKYYIIFSFLLFISCTKKINRILVNSTNMESTINSGSYVEYVYNSSYKLNDIIVFESLDKSKKQVLRIVGQAGDEILILKGKLIINNQEYLLDTSAKQVFKVYSKKKSMFNDLKDYGLNIFSENYATIKITEIEHQKIKKLKLVDSINLLGFDSIYEFPDILKTSTSKYFNHFYFGPIKIPNIGEVIEYKDKNLVKRYEVISSTSIVKDSLYFCIGDSFSDAFDSRVIGLIPKRRILGKVIKIENSSYRRIP